MSQPIQPELGLCSPAVSLEILQAFSGSHNGEATVRLVLRHIVRTAGITQAATILPSVFVGRKPLVIAVGDYDPLTAVADESIAIRLPLRGAGKETELGLLVLPLPAGETTAWAEKLQYWLAVLAMALEKRRAEKQTDLLARRHASLEHRLKRQGRFLASLYRISLDMVEQKDYNDLLHSILHHSQTIMEARFAAIYMLNESRTALEMIFLGPGVDESLLGLKLAPGEGGTGLAWQTGEFVVVNDYPNWPGRVKLPWLDQVGTLVFVPLGHAGKVVGVVALGFDEPQRKVSLMEKTLLLQFANLAAIIAENVRLFAGMARKEEDFTREIHLAAEVQQAYLPFNHEDARVQVKGIFQPLQTVSGDLFDYFWLTQGDVLFGYVADVTGHGVTAGLRTAALSALFREAAELGLPLVEKLKWVHGRSLGYFSEGAYFAAIGFELDFRQGELRVACGGMYEFFMKTRYYVGRIEMTGSLMGLKKTPNFEERTYPARKGDCFYFLTDGFSELLDKESFPKPDFHETCRCLEDLR